MRAEEGGSGSWFPQFSRAPTTTRRRGRKKKAVTAPTKEDNEDTEIKGGKDIAADDDDVRMVEYDDVNNVKKVKKNTQA